MPIGMASLSGSFFGLPLPVLNSLMADMQACLIAIATAGQEYTISGRTFKRPDMEEVRQNIMELQAAIDRANGVRQTSTYPAFQTPYHQ